MDYWCFKSSPATQTIVIYLLSTNMISNSKATRNLLACVVVLCLVTGTSAQNINCTAMLHSTSTTQDTTPCTCKAPYTWNSTAKVCGILCSGVATSTQVPVSGSAFECGCPSGTTWFNVTVATGSPGCNAIDCTKIPYTDKTVLSASGTCSCVTRFTWNSTVKRCTLNCASITVGAGGAATPKLLANGVCQCAANYSWDSVSMICAKLDCSIVDHVFPGSSVTTAGTCVCD